MVILLNGRILPAGGVASVKGLLVLIVKTLPYPKWPQLKKQVQKQVKVQVKVHLQVQVKVQKRMGELVRAKEVTIWR